MVIGSRRPDWSSLGTSKPPHPQWWRGPAREPGHLTDPTGWTCWQQTRLMSLVSLGVLLYKYRTQWKIQTWSPLFEVLWPTSSQQSFLNNFFPRLSYCRKNSRPSWNHLQQKLQVATGSGRLDNDNLFFVGLPDCSSTWKENSNLCSLFFVSKFWLSCEKSIKVNGILMTVTFHDVSLRKFIDHGNQNSKDIIGGWESSNCQTQPSNIHSCVLRYCAMTSTSP